jgi:hypothetical protein
MPLADLLEASPAGPPPDVTCTRYEPGARRRCASYLTNGACAHPDEFMCVEWLRLNADRPATASAPASPALPAGALLTREDVASFARLGVEIECSSPLGTFWLVPARTGQDRLEFTPEEAVVLVNIVQVFGGQVVAVTRPRRSAAVAAPGVEDPAAASARTHLDRLRAAVRPPVQQLLFDGARGPR